MRAVAVVITMLTSALAIGPEASDTLAVRLTVLRCTYVLASVANEITSAGGGTVRAIDERVVAPANPSPRR